MAILEKNVGDFIFELIGNRSFLIPNNKKIPLSG